MTKVFLDTDIILDLLARREPFFSAAAKLFTLIDRRNISGYTSALSFANLHYLLKKASSNKDALKSLRKIKTMIVILPVDGKVIEQALNSDFNDFEDAIQNFTAINNGINLLLTRNIPDYKRSKISITSPEEFLKSWKGLDSND